MQDSVGVFRMGKGVSQIAVCGIFSLTTELKIKTVEKQRERVGRKEGKTGIRIAASWSYASGNQFLSCGHKHVL